jgi:hypothetical protein
VFKKNNLDKENEEISFKKFKTIVKENPKIYKQGLEGFHHYLWLHEKGVPKYKTISLRICGHCYEVDNDHQQFITLVNIKDSLLVFQDEQMNQLLSIKNLEGLNIQAASGELGFGFLLSHQDGFYPQKMYLFPTK